MNPPRWKVTLAAAALLAAGPALSTRALARDWQAQEQIPGASPVTVLVEGNSRVYYRLTPTAPLALHAAGPGKLRLVTRVELPAGVAGPVSYSLRITEGREAWLERASSSSPSSQVRLESGSAGVCQSRTIDVDVPEGEHDVQIAVSGTPKVLVRVLVSAPKRQEGTMVSITPVDASRSVTVSEGERLIPYYTVSRRHPVRVRVVGPTQVELSSRLDFDATMRGVQRYTLAVSLAGKRLKQAKLSTTKAVTANYTDLKERIPSKLDRTVLSVGPGLHELTVELLEPPGGSAEIHVRIPQPSVGNAE